MIEDTLLEFHEGFYRNFYKIEVCCPAVEFKSVNDCFQVQLKFFLFKFYKTIEVFEFELESLLETNMLFNYAPSKQVLNKILPLELYLALVGLHSEIRSTYLRNL